MAMRITLFSWILLQLHNLKQISECFPKLPPPFPPPFSGRSFSRQFSLFWRKRQELGCPSFLWFLASFTVQLPCFLLWMASIRIMSLDQFPGFDTISFRSSLVEEGKGMLSLLAKLYKMYLEVLTLLILFVGFYLPQGSLVYWVTNSSLTLIQQSCLQNPSILQKLGLLGKSPNVVDDSEKSLNQSTLPDAPRKRGPVSAFDLSPLQLVNQSVSYLSTGRIDKALPLLRLALSKDSEWYVAWTVLGQAMLQLKDYEEAAEFLEAAIADFPIEKSTDPEAIDYFIQASLSAGAAYYRQIPIEKSTDPEAIDYFIQASLSAGAAYYRQGKLAESFAHFERFRDIEVPENPTVKALYYEGLVCYSSFLLQEGRKDEASKYLRMAVAYDSQYSVYLENLEKDADNFVGDLASSGRADY